MTSAIDILKNGLVGDGGIIQKGQKIAENMLDSTKLHQSAKDTIKDIGRAALSQIPGSQSSQNDDTPSGRPATEMPSSRPATDTPSGRPRSVSGLSGWDKFKNFFAGISNKVLAPMGVPEAHIIKPEDYIKDPKTGKEVFSWDKANDNFKKDNGRARSGFDLGKIASTAAKYIK